MPGDRTGIKNLSYRSRVTLCDTVPMTENSFDLVRITHTKEEVDISTEMIRAYCRQGLRLYKVGKAAFISRTELADFIKSHAIARVRFSSPVQCDQAVLK